MTQILGRTGNIANVNKDGQLLTKTVARRNIDNAVENSDGWTFYFFNSAATGNALTTANESGIAYIINNNTRDLVLNAFVAYYGAPTTAGVGTLRFYKNPTAGTLIDSGTTINAIIDNANFGSKATAASVNLEAKGGDGTALTITTPAAGIPLPQQNPGTGDSEIFDFVPVILPQGASIAFTYQAPAGNTSMDITFIVAAHFRDED